MEVDQPAVTAVPPVFLFVAKDFSTEILNSPAVNNARVVEPTQPLSLNELKKMFRLSKGKHNRQTEQFRVSFVIRKKREENLPLRVAEAGGTPIVFEDTLPCLVKVGDSEAAGTKYPTALETRLAFAPIVMHQKRKNGKSVAVSGRLAMIQRDAEAALYQLSELYLKTGNVVQMERLLAHGVGCFSPYQIWYRRFRTKFNAATSREDAVALAAALSDDEWKHFRKMLKPDGTSKDDVRAKFKKTMDASSGDLSVKQMREKYDWAVRCQLPAYQSEPVPDETLRRLCANAALDVTTAEDSRPNAPETVYYGWGQTTPANAVEGANAFIYDLTKAAEECAGLAELLEKSRELAGWDTPGDSVYNIPYTHGVRHYINGHHDKLFAGKGFVVFNLLLPISDGSMSMPRPFLIESDKAAGGAKRTAVLLPASNDAFYVSAQINKEFKHEVPECTNPNLEAAVSAYSGNEAVLRELEGKGFRLCHNFLSPESVQGLGDLVRSCIEDGRLRPPPATATMDPTPRLRGNVPKTIFQHFFCRGCGEVVRPDARRCVCGLTWAWEEARPPNA